MPSCFFFSSRRRHTRCSRDWSSDVCSSDLSRRGERRRSRGRRHLGGVPWTPAQHDQCNASRAARDAGGGGLTARESRREAGWGKEENFVGAGTFKKKKRIHNASTGVESPGT